MIRTMNPTAKLIQSEFSKVPVSSIVGTGLFSFAQAESSTGWLAEARLGEHVPETLEYDIGSFTLIDGWTH